MQKEHHYLQDLAAIRAMMERSSKFLSLSGWAGVLVGGYALAGAWVAQTLFPQLLAESTARTTGTEMLSPAALQLVGVALLVLLLSLATGIGLSCRKARKRGEGVWNAASKLLLAHMAVPLLAGGGLLLVLLAKGLVGLLIPAALLFYGLALYSASQFTYRELAHLGLIQIGLGLLCACFSAHGLLFWSLGFGLAHMGYGLYMHLRYRL